MDMETTQMVINGLVMLIAFFGGWFIRDIKRVQESNSERLRQVELLVTGSYVTRAEFEAKIIAMFGKLDKIHDGVTVCMMSGNAMPPRQQVSHQNYHE